MSSVSSSDPLMYYFNTFRVSVTLSELQLRMYRCMNSEDQ
uniref:Uncharacterized protein n=1 Tax=Arundo donax TaxID=35708 RepID=A0A0A9EWF1_ARUDO